MLPNFLRTAVVIALLAATGLPTNGQSPAGTPPTRGLVILRNGQVIEGTISHDEGIYTVGLPNGLIRIRQADVELVCKNLEEGYRRKRAIIQVGNVHDHLDLAEWCLRHNLLGLATVELADATAADPKNPMIAALRHRLKMAMEPPPPPDPHSKRLLTPGPSNDDLDRMVRGMPRGAVETFTQSVQPLLLNNCATAGCHGAESETGLRLWHIASGRPSSRRTTQRNLFFALQFIDRENPSASRLLAAASKPHGTVQHPIFSEHQTLQYQRLLDWANQVARPTLDDQPESLARSGPPEVSDLPGEAAPARLPRESPRARLLQSAVRRRPPRDRDAETPGKPDKEATPASFDQPADPLDPDGFNRRYGPKK